HTVYPAFDVLRVIGQGNTTHRGAALGGEVGTFYVQIFDQGNVVAGLQNGTVGIAGRLTIFFRTAGFGPLAGVVFHIHNIQQILRPGFTSRSQTFQHPVRHHLHRRHLAPHTVVQTTPVVSIGVSARYLRLASATEHHAG